jgi:hypothetical protein
MKADLDIGSLIYIILTIVFIIAGAVGKKKKPAPSARQAGTSEPRDTGSGIRFEDIMRELNPVPIPVNEPEFIFGSEKTVEDSPVIDTVPEPYAVEDTIPADTQPIDNTRNYRELAKSSLDTVSSNEGSSVFGYAKAADAGQDYDPDDITNPQKEDLELVLADINESFDAREAFIYSEIFKRKDF